MTLSNIASKAERIVSKNSPAILSAIGVSGTITTAYLAGKASFKAAFVIQADEDVNGSAATSVERLKENTKLVWRLYIPTGISAAVTIGCIIGATKVSARRAAVVTAAYSLSERAFSEYRDKVVEKFGESKEQTVRDEIAQDRINKNPVSGREVIVVGSGNVLCCELHSGRYFQSDMETLRRAQNDTNAQLLSQDEASLSDFYYRLSLPPTALSGNMGWTSDRLLDLDFSTVLSDDNRPCLAFNYNYIKLF